MRCQYWCDATVLLWCLNANVCGDWCFDEWNAPVLTSVCFFLLLLWNANINMMQCSDVWCNDSCSFFFYGDANVNMMHMYCFNVWWLNDKGMLVKWWMIWNAGWQEMFLFFCCLFGVCKWESTLDVLMKEQWMRRHEMRIAWDQGSSFELWTQRSGLWVNIRLYWSNGLKNFDDAMVHAMFSILWNGEWHGMLLCCFCGFFSLFSFCFLCFFYEISDAKCNALMMNDMQWFCSFPFYEVRTLIWCQCNEKISAFSSLLFSSMKCKY